MARSVVTQKRLLKFEGLTEALGSVDELSKDMAVGMKKVFMRAAMKISDEVLRNVDNLPVNEAAKVELKAAVLAAYGKEKRPNVIVGVSAGHAKRKLGRYIANPYWFEFGTADRTTKSNARRGKMNATPYFRPAVTASKGTVRDTIAEGLIEIVQRAGKK